MNNCVMKKTFLIVALVTKSLLYWTAIGFLCVFGFLLGLAVIMAGMGML